MNGTVITWSFENWLTIGLMSLAAFMAYHFVMGKAMKGDK